MWAGAAIDVFRRAKEGLNGKKGQLLKKKREIGLKVKKGALLCSFRNKKGKKLRRKWNQADSIPRPSSGIHSD